LFNVEVPDGNTENDQRTTISENEDLKLQVMELKASEEQQKKVESALRASEEQFRRFFNTAPVGLSISNAQGELLNANNVVQELLDFSLEEFKTMNIHDIYYDPSDRQRLLKCTV